MSIHNMVFRKGQIWRIQPEGPDIFGQLAAVWRHRRLLWFLSLRILFHRYRNAILGVAWLLIRPLTIAIPATYVVRHMLGISVDPVPLPLFILAGLAIWILFRRSLQMIGKSMIIGRQFLRRIYVPALLFLPASVLPAIVEFLVVMGVVAALVIYLGPIEGVFYVSLGWNTLALVPAILLTLLLASGLGCFLAIFSVFARDALFTMGYVLSVWMLATPIVYPIEAVPDSYRWAFYLNPMTPIVELFRWAVLGYGTVNWPFVGVAMTEILGLCLLGIWFFAGMQTRLFDHT